MCTLFLFVNQIENYPIVLISNRDEYRFRKSSMIEGWNNSYSSFGNDIFGPRDESQKGTWFACQNKLNSKWGIITNIRDMKSYNKDLRSRGEIIPNFLNSSDNCVNFLDKLKNISASYNFFNLLISDSQTVYYYNSKNKTSQLLFHCDTVEKKIFGLSNAEIDSKWPKIIENKNKFAEYLINNYKSTLNFCDYWQYFRREMMNSKTFSLDKLPNTGVGPDREIFLSSLFISGKDYGTTSTILFAIKSNSNMEIYEQNYDENANRDQEKNIELNFYSYE